jgi:endonuclease-3
MKARKGTPPRGKAQKRESPEDRKKRASTIIARLKGIYPDATTALDHSTPLELLISTILSAQCTDERVNIVTKDLFRRYRSVKDFATANPAELEKIIRSTGFFRAKTKSIINCCKALLERHDGKVPDTMEDLVELPGVGRKTANVILGNFFGKAEGIVVDTHVKRLSERLGFSRQSDPEKIEADLMEIISREDWIEIGNLLIWHGRKTCQARKPKCLECGINDLCPSMEIFVD